MHKEDQPLIFEGSTPGRIGYSLPEFDVPEVDLQELIPAGYIREQEPELPELSELDIMRHYTALSNRNHGLDTGFYPLGSCTMRVPFKEHLRFCMISKSILLRLRVWMQ